ncbi:MAG: hypothetical protein OXH37_01435, partial [Gammaproteobacteria bacterium]|nr:hypothetical protein [Gammaproteobacteria bacterium]
LIGARQTPNSGNPHAPGAWLIELGGAPLIFARFNPELIVRPVALRPLAGGLLAPESARQAVLHPAVAVPDPYVKVRAVGLHGVAFGQLGGAMLPIAERQRLP